MAAEVEPHVVIMDVNLGEESKDGVTAAGAIREHRPVHVIYVTAYADDPAVRPRLEATAPAAILGKPVDERRMQRELARISSGLQ
jgi:DNA-binding NarL/FixJ family response regulator